MINPFGVSRDTLDLAVIGEGVIGFVYGGAVILIFHIEKLLIYRGSSLVIDTAGDICLQFVLLCLSPRDLYLQVLF